MVEEIEETKEVHVPSDTGRLRPIMLLHSDALGKWHSSHDRDDFLSFVRTWSTFASKLHSSPFDYVNFAKMLMHRWPSTVTLNEWLVRIYPALAFPYGSLTDHGAVIVLANMCRIQPVSILVSLVPLTQPPLAGTTGLTIEKLVAMLEIRTHVLNDSACQSLAQALDTLSSEHLSSLVSCSERLRLHPSAHAALVKFLQ